MVVHSACFEEWRYGHCFNFYCTKGQECHGKVQTWPETAAADTTSPLSKHL